MTHLSESDGMRRMVKAERSVQRWKHKATAALSRVAELEAEVARLKARTAVRCPECEGNLKVFVPGGSPSGRDTMRPCDHCIDERTGKATGAVLAAGEDQGNGKS